LRAGKRLATRVTEITVEFKQPPLLLFDNAQGANCGEMQPNIISMRIQPDEGISLRFMGKSPGTTMSVCPVHMDFSYAEAFGKSSANGYERLLIDVMLGDGTLFAHRMGEEALWTIVDPVLDAWAKQKMDFPNYAAGSYGPKDVDALLAKDGRSWHSL
jgi:glucose-6-phosphate 1-dehydrogenase